MFRAWSIRTAYRIIDTFFWSWRLALGSDPSIGLLLTGWTSRTTRGMNIASRWWEAGWRRLALFTKKKGHSWAATAVVQRGAVCVRVPNPTVIR